MHTLPPWPYPFWIAHRGAGKLAPENTLAAFRAGQVLGYRMAECDVTLSADEQPFLLHDATLERTTDGRGVAAEHAWSALAGLDAGAWHGPRFRGERLPTLEALADHARHSGLLLNLELKPGPGQAARTGAVVAREVARLWADLTPPLLSSFECASLEAARAAVESLPRALLLERLTPGWLDTARDLGCAAVVVHCGALDVAAITRAHEAGLRVLSYTVNRAAEARRLQAAGIDGLITDAVDRFAPD
ncbi:glycerophosphodiester phosphodiesterase [Methylibium sp. Root1272]|uniref:glycerophosphodiester phosphodiesterase n=1 Tax=Methylibium sp. Root1272 TaxID=1736441 RepID=UPI0006F7B3C6|nr:glycerophosphodiester phosphodiesterase [Methylibium sp. Root1272]KQW74151.1 glycerophosphodiester phosphodiesterase [Methylibium sp. Root1272]